MNILLICTGNTCRSPMAEGILKSLLKSHNLNANVKSAGTDVFFIDHANEKAIQTMKDMGIDITEHVTKEVTPDRIEEADLILTMTHRHTDRIAAAYPEAISKTFTLKEYISLLLKEKGNNKDPLYTSNMEEMDIGDPYGQNIGEYKKIAKEIKQYLKKFIELLK